MKKAVLLSLLVLFISNPAMSRSIPDAPNLIEDPFFEDVSNNWYVKGVYNTTSNSPYLPGNTTDPGNILDGYVMFRDVVDTSTSLYDANLGGKEIDLTFFAYLTGDGVINVRFSWWMDPNISMPSDDPTSLPAPDGLSKWYTLTSIDLDEYTVRNDLLRSGEQLPPNFNLYCLHDTWDINPRYIAIQIEQAIVPDAQGNGDGITGVGESYLTGVDFEVKSVPEPGAMMLCLFGAVCWFFKRFKK